MFTMSRTRVREAFIVIPFLMALFFGAVLSPVAQAQDAAGSTEATSATPILSSRSTLKQINKYFSTQILTYSDGTSIEQIIINGPPAPPTGYELERESVALPKSNLEAGIKTLSVPAFNWVFGCSSVSGAMIAGYYDRNGYPNIYTGPTNGGVMPLNNSYWPIWSDGYKIYPNLPLAGSHNGVDGRTIRGSIDNYWIQYDSSSQDPYITNGWAQHAWGDAIGDYMKTSQSAYGNTDGSTKFYRWTSSASPLTCSAMVSYSIHTEDGTYGRKLFYEARGYTVTDCYSQKTDNTISGGFSFAQYRAEIDAGRPVMLNLEGHTIVGVGYDESTNTVYLHDTWDYSNHTMTWGSSYSGMRLQAVSIVNLQGGAVPVPLNGEPVPGDYDGDGKTDRAVWSPGEGDWNIQRSSDGGTTLRQWGAGSMNDQPVPGDYDGDGKADIAVWRPGEGNWYIQRSSDGGTTLQQWGAGSMNDKPVPGDYDGDGKADIAIWRPGEGNWYIQRSSDGGTTLQQWGAGYMNDQPVPGDYDGDGKTDIAIWRPEEGNWHIQRSSDGVTTLQQWGAGSMNDRPVPGDYDGDGKTDIAIWRPGEGNWYIQ